MNISFKVEFCLDGSFTPGCEGVDSWICTDRWENQYGCGRYFELNLIWLNFLFEVSRVKNNSSFVEADGDE